ncbi:probable E3 ubiquitin-protein ligase XERICO [Juglans microcarpa x Juglans regia]|uniref:probable E3 ubiquitin-protein ligase XERICO n=1 Tax=Juglans microcarpa x Juglans regia TaxID=2249226 RepID=UPI001B7F5F90|nr:probable E3 ubiquitin-protein ligase XERICO [Juglans microcarpa x Juglans regia]
MGLSNFFPSVAEGVLPVLVMNTILSMALLKKMVKSVLQMVGATRNPENVEEVDDPENIARDQRSRVSTRRLESLCHNCNIAGVGASIGSRVSMECCVCLCRFEADEEVSELSYKHFFHKDCLEKWFENRPHINTCPLCRSLD